MRVEIPDDFGNWLAGFIDGEGSFSIVRKKRGYAFGFRIWVRLDDAEIIREIQRRTGLGTIGFRSLRPVGVQRDYVQQRQIGWMLWSKADCRALVELLERYPLRAKKRRDLAIWREAVILWAGIRHVGKGGRRNDWSAIGILAGALRDAREFATTEDGAERDEPETPPQLALVLGGD